MRILYIAGVGTRAYRARSDHADFGLGGLRKAELTLEALTSAGHEVVMLSSAVPTDSRWTWQPEEREIWTLGSGRTVGVRYPPTIPVRPIGGLFNALRAPWIAERVIRSRRPDVLISYNSHLFEALASLWAHRKFDVPVLLQVEDLSSARVREYGNLKPWLDSRCWPAMLRAASGFTAVNDSILTQLPSDKPRHLLPGIIDDRLLDVATSRREAFTRMPHVLGYFGGLSAEKGVDVLVDAVPHLPRGWRLKVGGSGPLAQDLDKLARSDPERVEFLGNLSGDALYEALCSCDATVVPPEKLEGDGQGVFPFKVLEYLVAGTHIVATPLPDVGDIALQFTHRWDGTIDGLVQELQDAAAHFESERESRTNAIRQAADRFTITGTASLFSDLLRAAGSTSW